MDSQHPGAADQLICKVQACRLSEQGLEDRSGRAAIEPMLEQDQAVAVDRLIEVLSAKSWSPGTYTTLLIHRCCPSSVGPGRPVPAQHLGGGAEGG